MKTQIGGGAETPIPTRSSQTPLNRVIKKPPPPSKSSIKPQTVIHPSSPPDRVQERGRGRGILLAAAPHPETCPLCRCKLVGKGHS